MRTHHFLSIALVLFAAACADAPTAGDELSGVELQQLARLEAAERQRVAEIAAQSELTYDSLQAQFLLGGIIETADGVATGLVTTTGEVLSGVLGLLFCQPERYTATVQIVGRDGGVVRVGQHRLSIPPNALREPTVITAERVTDRVASLRFSPHGLAFTRSASLTMSYSHCSPAERNRMAYTDEQLNILEYPPSRDDRGAQEVEAWIDHFSRYAVAY